ncbi:MAG TPA: 2-phosphosulfolactate phosphatase [Anaerolineaceae bacterium]
MSGRPHVPVRMLNLDQAHLATDVTVVVDVLRAFSAEAFAFGSGAKEILAVATVEEALAWKQKEPEVIVFGEVKGEPPPGFDLGNSPSQMAERDLTGRRLVHRSSAGTQGVVNSASARITLVASFAVARATAQYLQSLAPRQVDFVITGSFQQYVGEDDLACADYIAALFQGEDPPPQIYLDRMYASRAGQMFLDKGARHLWRRDLQYCVMVNHFPFAMRVDRRDGVCVVRRVEVGR